MKAQASTIASIKEHPWQSESTQFHTFYTPRRKNNEAQNEQQALSKCHFILSTGVKTERNWTSWWTVNAAWLMGKKPRVCLLPTTEVHSGCMFRPGTVVQAIKSVSDTQIFICYYRQSCTLRRVVFQTAIRVWEVTNCHFITMIHHEALRLVQVTHHSFICL